MLQLGRVGYEKRGKRGKRNGQEWNINRRETMGKLRKCPWLEKVVEGGSLKMPLMLWGNYGNVLFEWP